jgi:hypothetical protein
MNLLFCFGDGFRGEGRMVRNLVLATAAGLTLTSLATPADAQRKRADGVVRTCSIYGNGCTSAPVRRARFGYEFRMPGGTWESCRADCKNAIREDMLDFWETQRERQRGSSR